MTTATFRCTIPDLCLGFTFTQLLTSNTHNIYIIVTIHNNFICNHIHKLVSKPAHVSELVTYLYNATRLLPCGRIHTVTRA